MSASDLCFGKGNPWCAHHGGACGYLAMFSVALIAGVAFTVLANWRRKGGPFKDEYLFVGAELATSTIVAGTVLLVYLAYMFSCKDGHGMEWLTKTTRRAAAPGLILIGLRFFRYCRNQEKRATLSGLTRWRGLKNIVVGSFPFALTIVDLLADDHDG